MYLLYLYERECIDSMDELICRECTNVQSINEIERYNDLVYLCIEFAMHFGMSISYLQDSIL